jgi:hypothetical protein
MGEPAVENDPEQRDGLVCPDGDPGLGEHPSMPSRTPRLPEQSYRQSTHHLTKISRPAASYRGRNAAATLPP